MIVKGRIKIIKNGKIIQERDNLVVDSGLKLMINMLGGSLYDDIDAIEVGTSNISAQPSDTTLLSPLSPRKTCAKVESANTLTCSASWTAGEATGVWAEVGLWTDVAAGTLFSRVVLDPAITKGAEDELTVQWVITCERK